MDLPYREQPKQPPAGMRAGRPQQVEPTGASAAPTALPTEVAGVTLLCGVGRCYGGRLVMGAEIPRSWAMTPAPPGLWVKSKQGTAQQDVEGPVVLVATPLNLPDDEPPPGTKVKYLVSDASTRRYLPPTWIDGNNIEVVSLRSSPMEVGKAWHSSSPPEGLWASASEPDIEGPVIAVATETSDEEPPSKSHYLINEGRQGRNQNSGWIHSDKLEKLLFKSSEIQRKEGKLGTKTPQPVAWAGVAAAVVVGLLIFPDVNLDNGIALEDSPALAPFVPLIANLLARSKVTPLSNPKLDSTTPLEPAKATVSQ